MSGASVEYALSVLAARTAGGRSHFQGFDVDLGHTLASRVEQGLELSDKQQAVAYRLLRKYAEPLAALGVPSVAVPAGLLSADGEAPEEEGSPRPVAAQPPSGVRIACQGEKIVVRGSRYVDRETYSGVPGAYWHKSQQAWTYPRTPTSAANVQARLAQFRPETSEGFLALVAEAEALKDHAAVKERDDLDPIPGEVKQSWMHQRRAFWYASRLPGAVLNMDMGTGKSKCAIDLIRESGAKKVLIVAPDRVVSVWPLQFRTHGPSRLFHVIDGKKELRSGRRVFMPIKDRTRVYDEALNDCRCGKAHVILSNYAASAHEPFASWAQEQQWDYFVLDEIHKIKSVSGVWAKWAAKMYKHTERRLGLTGTLMPQIPPDVWSQYRAIDPDVFGKSHIAFERRFCNTPDAPIWMADLSFKPLGEIVAGDEVMGWITEHGRRRLQPATVEAVMPRTAPSVVRVTMESGRVLRCTPDHRWLSGWHGGTGEDPSGPWITVCPPARIQRDFAYPTGQCPVCGGPSRKRTGTRGPVPRYCSPECGTVTTKARRAKPPQRRSLAHVVDPTPLLDDKQQRAAIWLAGVYDGEGHGVTICQDGDHNPEVCARIEESLDLLGIPWSRDGKIYRFLGGRQTYVNFLNWTRGYLVRDWWIHRHVMGQGTAAARMKKMTGRRPGSAQLGKTFDCVETVEDEGPGEVIGLQTSTGNYVAWGYASKNCEKGGYEGREFKRMNPDTFAEFSTKLHSILFSCGNEMLDLPEELPDSTFTCTLSPAAAKIYKNVDEELYSMIRAMDIEEAVNAPNVLVKLIRLAQITGGVVGVESGAKVEVDTSKAALLQDVLEDIDHSKPVIVFARFISDLDAIARVAEKLGRRYGELSGRRDDALTHDATLAEGVEIAGVQIQAGGTGVDFSRSHYCIYYSVGYSLADYEQSRARLRRPGQKNSVMFIHLVCEATVDVDILEALAERKSVVAHAIAKRMERG